MIKNYLSVQKIQMDHLVQLKEILLLFRLLHMIEEKNFYKVQM